MNIALLPELEQVLPALLLIMVVVGVGHSILVTYVRTHGAKAIWLETLGIFGLALVGSGLLVVGFGGGTAYMGRWMVALVPLFLVPLATASAVTQWSVMRKPGLSRGHVFTTALVAFAVALPIGFAVNLL
jgi:uncharacterized membrane protein YqhA